MALLDTIKTFQSGDRLKDWLTKGEEQPISSKKIVGKVAGAAMSILGVTTAQSGEQTQKNIYNHGVYTTQEFVLKEGVDWDLYIDYAKKELYEANEDENGNIHPEDQDFIDKVVIQMEDEGFYDRISPWLEEIYRYTGMKLRGIDMIHMAELVMFLDEGKYIEAKNIIDFYLNLEGHPGFLVAFNKLGLIPVEV